MPIIQTLGIITENDKILLGMKKRGFGVGWWNGLGGKAKPEETVEEALIRECKEEANIQVNEFDKIGIINFHFPDKEIEVNIYKIKRYTGTPTETEEMKWEWFKLNSIPYHQMWPADNKWLPLFLRERCFKGDIYFDENKQLIDHKLEIVSSI